MTTVSRRTAARTIAGAIAAPFILAFPARIRAQEKPTIRIGTIPTEIAAAVYYARELGYFTKAGYEVVITPISNGAAVSSAVLAGAIDVGFSNPVSLNIAHDRGLPIHLDGARIFNAATALNIDVATLTEGYDSVNFCLSKGLCAPVGSILVSSRKNI